MSNHCFVLNRKGFISFKEKFAILEDKYTILRLKKSLKTSKSKEIENKGYRRTGSFSSQRKTFRLLNEKPRIDSLSLFKPPTGDTLHVVT